MKRALLFGCCGLLGCVLDTSLGSHHAASQGEHPAEAEARDEDQSPDARAERSASKEAEPRLDAATHGDAPATGSADEPAPGEPAPDAGHETPRDPVPTGDHPTEQDAAVVPPDPPPHDQPVTDPPAETPPPESSCDAPTDNPCLSCDQSNCCEPRRACLEVEGCACRLRCRTAEHPEDCNLACPAAPDHYEPWLQCLRDHCADACVL